MAAAQTTLISQFPANSTKLPTLHKVACTPDQVRLARRAYRIARQQVTLLFAVKGNHCANLRHYQASEARGLVYGALLMGSALTEPTVEVPNRHAPEAA